MKKISVIVPVYNTGKYLEKCLESLVNQTYQDFTIIIVNDGSTDNSLEIILNYEKKYPHLFKVFNNKNGGRAKARNFGISKVKTEFFTFVDSDDYVDLNMLLNFMKCVDKDTDVVVCDGVRIINGKEWKMFKFYNNLTDDKRKNLILSHPGPCAKLYRTSIFKDNNLFFPENIKLYEDLPVIPLVALYTDKIKYIEKTFYKYVIHKGSALRQKYFNPNMCDIFEVMNILDSNLLNKYDSELEYLYITHLLRSASLRFVSHKEGKIHLKKISDIMHDRYPTYYNNEYYHSTSYKFKIICFLSYHKMFTLLKMLNNLNQRRQNIR